jgi:hypothetical protein
LLPEIIPACGFQILAFRVYSWAWGPRLLEFVEYADQEPENVSDDLTKLAQIARRIISEVSQ